MKFVFSIVSHGQRSEVEALLESLERWVVIGPHSLELIITNNLGDSDWKVKCSSIVVKTINNPRPKGFGDNHNSAFSTVSCDVFCVVNPDIVFIKDFDLNVLASVAGRKCIASPNILESDFSPADFRRADLTPVNLLRRKFFQTRQNVDLDFDWIAGMFLVFPSDFFRDIKGFDTRYFMYVEDCDICRTASKYNGELKVLEALVVCHHAQRQSRRSLKHFRWHVASLLRFWLKNLWEYSSRFRSVE